MIKKLCVILAVLTLVLPLSANGQKETLSKVDQIKKAGKLVLGTSADYPPYEFHMLTNGKDTIVGFDIAIAEEIAKDLGVRLEIKDMDFDGLLAALAAGNVDMVISGMTPTEERKKNVDFSEIYYTATHGAVIRKTDALKLGSDPASLKNAMLGVQRGTIQSNIAKTQIKGMSDADAVNNHPQIKELGKLPDLVMEVKNSKVDAIIAELPVAKAYVDKNPDLVTASYVFTDDEGGSAIAIKKGNTDLLETINKTLKRLIGAGKIDQFVAEANLLADQL